MLMKVESHKETNSLCDIRLPIIRLGLLQSHQKFHQKAQLKNNYCAELVEERDHFPARLGDLIFRWMWGNLHTALTQIEVVP